MLTRLTSLVGGTKLLSLEHYAAVAAVAVAFVLSHTNVPVVSTYGAAVLGVLGALYGVLAALTGKQTDPPPPAAPAAS